MTGADKLQEGSKVRVEIPGERNERRGGQAAGRPVRRRQAQVNPSRTFILRPVATSLLMVGILLAGMVAYKQLPVSALPEVDYPTIQVITFYPGASPDVMASSVTAPLERQFGQVPGLQQMTSTSSDGASVITLQFKLSLNIDVAEQEVQQSINASGTFLPPDLPTPPFYSKTNPADTPILTLALTSKTMAAFQSGGSGRHSPGAQDLATCRASGLVTHQRRPKARGADPGQPHHAGFLRPQSGRRAQSAITAANVNQAKGTFDGRYQSFQIGANDQLLSSSDYSTRDPGLPQRRAGETDRRGDRQGRCGEYAAGGVDERLARRDRQHPAAAGRQYHRGGGWRQEAAAATDRDAAARRPDEVLTDRTNTIRASVKDVEFALMLTVVLVVLVIFVFLRNLSATMIPSVAVPLSLVGTLAIMYLLGYSLNNLTLMALTISTGFVVDDAIVMIENIERYIEQGEKPLAGGAQGKRADRLHDHFPDGLADRGVDPAAVHGRYRGPAVPRIRRHAECDDPGFGGGVADADADDGGEAAEAPPAGTAGPPLPRVGERLQQDHRILRQDAPSSCFAIRPRRCWWLPARWALTIFLFVVIPKGFFPIQDTGVIQGISEAAQTVSFPEMSNRQQALAKVILKDPAVESLSSFIGIDGTNNTLNSGRIQINLKPLDAAQRERDGSDPAPAAETGRRVPESPCSCSRCRT